MQVDNDMLMAYADGELDAAQAAAVEQAVAADPALAAQLARHRALRAQLQGAYDGALAEPVPKRLLRALRQPQREAAAPPGVREWLQRQREALFGGWAWPQWSAVAASVAIAGLVGLLVMRDRDSGWIANHAGRLMARGALSAALDSQASGARNSAIQLVVSFRDQQGDYCRSFVVTQSQALAGLACKRGGAWQVDLLSTTDAAQGTGLRQAGSGLPAAVLERISAQIQGEPLDARGEQQALQRGWRAAP